MILWVESATLGDLLYSQNTTEFKKNLIQWSIRPGHGLDVANDNV